MKHRATHPEPQPDCFACKLASIEWGIVPGGYRDQNSATNFDKEAIMSQFTAKDGEPIFSKERINDSRSDVEHRTKEFLSYEA